MDEQEQKGSETPPPTPACFESDEQWNDYRVFWKLSQGWAAPRICVDCTPEYRDQMTSQSRCAHPETVFIKQNDGETIGVDGIVWTSWVNAITGKRGVVVSKPSKIVLDAFMQTRFGAGVDDWQTFLLKRPDKMLKAAKTRERRAAIRAKVKELREQGKSFAEIARSLDISRSTAKCAAESERE